MMFHPPKVPADKSSFSVWLQYLVRWITSERILQIKGFTSKETADGKIFVPSMQAPGAATTKTTLSIRGLWVANPASPYNAGDIVQLATGTSAGFYYSTINNNLNAPDSGIGWTQFSSFATWL